MKKLIVLLLCATNFLQVEAQSKMNPRAGQFYLKLDPSEILFDFPRIGLAGEQKWNTYSIWSSVHYGWEGLKFIENNYYSDPFTLWGIKSGIKRISPDGNGEQYFGLQLSFDKTSADISDNVFYDLKNNSAVLFDRAVYQRSRVKLFLEKGFEAYFGKMYSLEFALGAGVNRVDIWYKNIQNPFSLSEVPPRHFHRKSQHKYAGEKWKFAVNVAFKFGIRLF